MGSHHKVLVFKGYGWFSPLKSFDAQKKKWPEVVVLHEKLRSHFRAKYGISHHK